MTTKSFLPKGYSAPKQSSNYLKLEDGDTKFRILSDAVVGRIDRNEKVPVRTKEKPETNFDEDRPARHFWSFVIWNYDEEIIQIAEFTQRSIQNGIMSYYQDEDFGDPKGYDIKINKSGKELETKYQVKGLSKSDVSPDIMQKYLDEGVDLEMLFEGGDPFKSKKD